MASPRQTAPDYGYQDMDGAPKGRPVYLAADPDDPGVLAFWRTTRRKVNGKIGWREVSFWAEVLTKREIDFEPLCWRESLSPETLAALAAQSQAVVMEDAA
jgi:hypothetical protein